MCSSECASSYETRWVTLRNRSDYVLERVRVVLRDPQGASFVSADPTPRYHDQTVTWDIPTMDRGVLGPFRVTYRVAGAVSSHVWVEFRHRHSHGCSDDDCLPAFVSEMTSESTPVAAAD